MNILRGAAVCSAILLAAACAQITTDASIKTQQSHRLIAKTFLDLPAWSLDRHGEALHAFLKSCPVLVSRAAPVKHDVFEGPPDWRRVCAEAGQTDPDDQVASRLFFETWFRPYLVTVRSAQDGLFTGYFEAELRGARNQDETFKYPLYAIPSDLISVDLGRFDGRLRGRSVIGRVEGGRMLPYYRRADIQQGSIGRRAKVLAWVDDQIDAFLLHVQGSGRILLPDGDVLRVGYAGNNGYRYVSIGRALIKEGELSAGQAGWSQIRLWIETNPQKVDALLAENPRYIFFREIPGDGPIGAQGVVLTPRRSLAVDRRYIPLGVPLWLDTVWPSGGKLPLRRLMVAQDTGSAIKGPIRGDFFWGYGQDALAEAGRMKSRGNYYLLLPKLTEPPSS